MNKLKFGDKLPSVAEGLIRSLCNRVYTPAELAVMEFASVTEKTVDLEFDSGKQIIFEISTYYIALDGTPHVETTQLYLKRKSYSYAYDPGLSAESKKHLDFIIDNNQFDDIAKEEFKLSSEEIEEMFYEVKVMPKPVVNTFHIIPRNEYSGIKELRVSSDVYRFFNDGPISGVKYNGKPIEEAVFNTVEEAYNVIAKVAPHLHP